MQIYAIKAAIKNWERIKSKKININLLESYENAMTNDLPWLSNIKEILAKNGMTCFDVNKKYEEKSPFINKIIFQRLNDAFHQDAFNLITKRDSKLRTYGLLKSEKAYQEISWSPLIPS